jgi:spermidine synthase
MFTQLWWGFTQKLSSSIYKKRFSVRVSGSDTFSRRKAIMRLNLSIKPRTVGLSLAIISIILVILSLITEYLVEVVYLGSEAYWLKILDLFSVNLEESIPTWFATILLFMASGLLLLITLSKWRGKDKLRWQWLGLSLVFLYLSIDEGAVIHEILSEPLNAAFATTGYLYFGWQIVALPLVLIFALLYLSFLFQLPPRTRYGIIFAGLLYVAGAIFVEGLSADELYRSTSEHYGYLYLSIATLEEAMEMLGIVGFITVLLDYIVQQDGLFIFASSPIEEASEAALLANTEETQIPLAPEVDKASNDLLDRLLGQFQQLPYSSQILGLLAGLNLAFLSWMLLRELTAFMLSPERALFFLNIGIALGLALGLRYTGRFKGKWLPWMLAFGFLLQLTLPLALRLLLVALDQLQLDFLSWYLLPWLLPLLLSAYYSLCLPAFLKSEQSFKPIYLSFAGGLLSGLLSLLFLSHLGLFILLISTSILLLLLLFLLGLPRHLWLGLVFVGCTALWFFPALNAWTNSLWFQQLRGLPPDSSTGFSEYNFSHKIDVLQDSGGNLYLYVDGAAQFHPPQSPQQNILMGRVPASLMLPQNALVIGAGSMQMELMMANYAGHVTTLEQDALLLQVSREQFISYNFMDRLQNRSLINAEPVAFLDSTEESYELIALSYSSVSSLQTGSLYTVSFFELVSEHLSDEGVFVLNLTRQFTPGDESTRRIAASLLTVFDEVIVVSSRSTGLSFAYAGQQLPFSADDLQLAIEVAGETEFGIFETASVQAIAGNASSIHSGFDWLFLADSMETGE